MRYKQDAEKAEWVPAVQNLQFTGGGGVEFRNRVTQDWVAEWEVKSDKQRFLSAFQSHWFVIVTMTMYGQ